MRILQVKCGIGIAQIIYNIKPYYSDDPRAMLVTFKSVGICCCLVGGIAGESTIWLRLPDSKDCTNTFERYGYLGLLDLTRLLE